MLIQESENEMNILLIKILVTSLFLLDIKHLYFLIEMEVELYQASAFEFILLPIKVSR